MFFNEFVDVCQEVTSEFMFAILDCLHKCVPCLQVAFKLRHNYLRIFNNSRLGKDLPKPTYIPFPKPISAKVLSRLSSQAFDTCSSQLQNSS